MIKKSLSVLLAMVIFLSIIIINPIASSALGEYGKEGDVIFYDNSETKFGEVYCYLWNEGEDGNGIGEVAPWPGMKMELLGEDIWQYVLPADYDWIIFSDGVGTAKDHQTDDLHIPGNNYVAKGTYVDEYAGRLYDDYTIEINWKKYDGSGNVAAMYNNSERISGIDVKFDSDWFFNNSKEYNHDIAKLCSQIIVEGYQSSNDFGGEDNKGKIQDSDLAITLRELGFSTSDTFFEYITNAGRDEENYFITETMISKGDQSYHLIFVGCIGSNDKQWNSNFDPNGIQSGVSHVNANYRDNHHGFEDAKNYVYNGLLDYINCIAGIRSNNTKILLTGHSRGAAAANLLAAKLIDEQDLVEPENLFTYTFATPNPTKNVNEKGKADSKYNRIFNIVNPTDFVTKVMPHAWGYGRYGTTYALPTENNDTRYKESLKKKMMKYYKILNEAISGNSVYLEYSNGETDVYDLVKTMTTYVKGEIDYNYSEYWLGYSAWTPYDYFQQGICPLVNNSDKTEIGVAVTILLASFEGDNNIGRYIRSIVRWKGSKELFKKITSFFATEEALQRLIRPTFEMDPLKYKYGFKISALDGGRFADAHKADTYCAFMMGLSSKEVRFGANGKIRKPMKGTVNCPVDIEVIDKDTNEAVGRIVDNTVDEEIAEKENSIVMTVDGDEKTYWLPSDGNYEVHLIGNDDGVMDYTLSEVDSDIGETARMNYYDVDIVKDKEYICAVSKDVSEEEPEIDAYTLTDEAGNEIAPDESLTNEEEVEYSVDVNIEGSGSADSFTVTSGDYATLTAAPFRSDFIGWYQGDTLISDEEEYRFRPTEDITLTAKFTEAEPMLLGDVDIDDIISVVDATYILRIKAEITTFVDDAFLKNGDVDGSGELEVIDATYIQSWLAEMNVPYAIGEPMT